MYLSKGEYTRFSLKGKLNLLNEFGILVNEKHADDIEIKIYQLYDFYVEVLYEKHCVVKAEPVLFAGLLNYYI
jgi:uncharacterized protein YqgQ